MTDAISNVISGQPAYQPQQATPAKPEVSGATPQPKPDTVTISAQGKQVAYSTPYSPAEEAKESAPQKAVEASQGKK